MSMPQFCLFLILWINRVDLFHSEMKMGLNKFMVLGLIFAHRLC